MQCRSQHILYVCVFWHLVSNNGGFLSATGTSETLACDRTVIVRRGLTQSAEKIELLVLYKHLREIRSA